MLDTIESKRSEATIPRRDDAKRQNPGREHDHFDRWIKLTWNKRFPIKK